MTGIRINRTVGTTGLRENFDRDGGIEEPYIAIGDLLLLTSEQTACRFASRALCSFLVREHGGHNKCIR